MRVLRVLVAILVSGAAGTAVADPGMSDNDAGSGTDAGDTRATALAVASGVTYAGRVRGPDIDWYASSVAAGEASCARMTASSETSSYFALGLESGEGSTQAPILVGAGTQAVGGIAALAPSTSTLRVARASDASGPGHYQFRMDAVSLPTTGGDAGTGLDAGAADSPLPVGPGCVTGRLATIDDVRDVFSFDLAAGEVVTYSFAAGTSGSTLSLLDAVGNPVGPVLESGGLASASLPSGTYLLAAQRSTSLSEVPYVLGVTIGPDPTGCRPYCLG